MIFWIVAIWIVFSLVGFSGVVCFMTWPYWDQDWYTKESELKKGIDLTLCEVIFIFLVNLLPVVQISGTMMWIVIWWNRWRKGIPLPMWKYLKFPKINLPKCPIVVRAKEIE